jgi:hypothetical protein
VSGINCRAQLKDECYPDQALTVWCLLLPESVSWNVRNPTAGARITGHSSSSVLGRPVKTGMRFPTPGKTAQPPSVSEDDGGLSQWSGLLWRA